MIAKKCAVCGKTVFGSERMAKEQARWIESKGKVMRPYWSPECHAYHLTSEVEIKRSVRRFK